MREIKYIILHCTATQQTATVSNILKYWKEVLKWRSPGYHYLIEYSGRVNKLQDEKLIANGVAGRNYHSIHVSYIGGVGEANKPMDNRSCEQKFEMLKLVNNLIVKYPNAVVAGHNQFANKACPSFNTIAWLRECGIDEVKIYKG